ncbi:ribonucleotide reductase large subunit [Helicoverpa armigera multiple nucleopolyhedrovirus]|uniref:Ribonucleoside-diphosphate reductase n=1 Tax=Mamestra brassicae nuclear polyhedrosis virus TaxID=78219 RepID=A0A077D0Y5_NPVMB|nr:ribonucleotide reductase large subunit [Helicoverpa armigera multiple nucleopolyhedrovirus]AIL25241.1 rr1 [Mamestra brassicae multiple nucleopolyhedrovirus]
MYVVKRDGRLEQVSSSKLYQRIHRLCHDLNSQFVHPRAVSLKVIKGLSDNTTTEDIDIYAASVAAALTYKHYDYDTLAGRLLVTNMHKYVDESFTKVVQRLHKHNLVSDELLSVTIKHSKIIEENIDMKLDLDYNYFGYQTLKNGYLIKINEKVAERIQHMHMRIALGIFGDDIDSAIKSYKFLSRKMYTHASPTMFAAGTLTPQMSSCFLLTMESDSIRGIYNTLNDCAIISKHGGGIGLNVNSVRGRNSKIKSTNGTASGLLPMLRVFNNMVRHVDQGGKRKGAQAVYVEPWHCDIMDVLHMRRNIGSEDTKARDLMNALWVPDIFMKRVEENGIWSLMCPNECPKLNDTYGDDFEYWYKHYEDKGQFREQMPAVTLMRNIIEIQAETGTPYMLYKDACNRKSNQSNCGLIKCSNLCAEIVQYCAPDETAVCNLASIAVNKYINNDTFDFQLLHTVVKHVVNSLNKIIDRNFYPIETAKKSNMRHRPIGIGIQGLADAFVMLRIPYVSDAAVLLNKQIAETVYHAALEASYELASVSEPYSTFAGSKASEGILQYDLWNTVPTSLWDWSQLKMNIQKYGLRNSLLVAYMPTATTAQILNNNESFEPFHSNLFLRRVLSGEFQVVNRYLVDDLIKLNLYTNSMRKTIMANRGSIASIAKIPDNLKKLYMTIWEIWENNGKYMIEMAADRGAFIDQSQSFNVYMANPTLPKMASVHMYGWKRGLKTGMYYFRTLPAANSQQFTVSPNLECTKNSDCASCQS